jgi:hypothetical protein
VLQSSFSELSRFAIHVRNLLEARVIITSYNQYVRLLSPELWLVGTTKVYSGLGADIVMESLHSKPPMNISTEATALETPADFHILEPREHWFSWIDNPALEECSF